MFYSNAMQIRMEFFAFSLSVKTLLVFFRNAFLITNLFFDSADKNPVPWGSVLPWFTRWHGLLDCQASAEWDQDKI